MDGKKCVAEGGEEIMMPDEGANTAYQVRWAREEEWAPSMQMIWRTFLRFEGDDYTDEGIKNFFDLITDDGLYVSFLRGEYRLMSWQASASRSSSQNSIYQRKTPST